MADLKAPPLTLLQYFAPTPLSFDLRVGSEAVRLETNSPEILEKTALALGEAASPSGEGRPFLWRLVADDGENETYSSGAGGANRAPGATWPAPSGFRHEGLSLINFGQRGFLAVDASTKRALGFLPR